MRNGCGIDGVSYGRDADSFVCCSNSRIPDALTTVPRMPCWRPCCRGQLRCHSGSCEPPDDNAVWPVAARRRSDRRRTDLCRRCASLVLLKFFFISPYRVNQKFYFRPDAGAASLGKYLSLLRQAHCLRPRPPRLRSKPPLLPNPANADKSQLCCLALEGRNAGSCRAADVEAGERESWTSWFATLPLLQGARSSIVIVMRAATPALTLTTEVYR